MHARAHGLGPLPTSNSRATLSFTPAVFAGLLENIQDHLPFNLAVFQSLKMSIITLFTGHILACVWFVVGIQNVRRGKPSWLSTSRYPLAVQTVVNGTTTENTYDLYVASLYWAFTTMTTVGYGDLTPEGSDERLLAIFAMIVGVTVFGYSDSSRVRTQSRSPLLLPHLSRPA